MVSGESVPPIAQGILFTGEGVSALTPEHRELLREVASVLAGGQAVEASVVADTTAIELTELRPEQGQDPISASRDDFRQFAQEHGYTDQRACRTWATIISTAERWYGLPGQRFDDPYPRLMFLDPAPRLEPVHAPELRHGFQVLDLRSVYARLTVPEYPMQRRMWGHKWGRASVGSLAFLAHIVNEEVRPERPLPTNPAHFPRQQG